MQNNSSMNFVKGLGAGMLAGAAAVTVGKILLQDRHSVAKGSSKMVKAIGEFVDGVQTVFH
ncbi:MAG: hypothetical protein IKI29_04520 [Clostridia bacterium]|nr:hypothetical protein [Clostridia bacterium]